MGLTYRGDLNRPLNTNEIDNNFRHFTGSHAVTGSLVVTGGITGSLQGTATNALTASYAQFVQTFPYVGNAQISGTLFLSGSLIPNTNGVSLTSSFDLGSPTNAWKDIYVSSGSVKFVTPDRIVSLGISDEGKVIVSGSSESGSRDIVTLDEFGNFVLKSGSLVIGGSLSAQSSSLGTSSSFTAGGTGTQTSGSAGVTGSVDVTGSVTVSGGISADSGSLGSLGVGYNSGSSTGTSWTANGSGTQTYGSAGITGSLGVNGNVNVNGCLTLNCCELSFEGVGGAVSETIKTGSVVVTTIALTSSYGDITTEVDAAAASNGGVLYVYAGSLDIALSGTYIGSSFNGVRTFITVSLASPGAPDNLQVVVGTPSYTFSGLSPLFEISTQNSDNCAPIAEFCCDGITLYEDVTLEGDLLTGDDGCISLVCAETSESIAEFCCDGITLNQDTEINGCLTVNCCEALYSGAGGEVIDGTKSGSLEIIYVAFSSSYGDITAQLDTAAAANNGNLYYYAPAFDVLLQAVYEGSNYNGVRTFVTASGVSNAPNGTVVYVGAPGYNFITEGDLFEVNAECTPVAEFCCDGITLTGDTVISGSLDVTGPGNFHDGLIVTGCIEILCPGDEASSYYGYGANVNDAKEIGFNNFNIYTSLNASYGDVTFYVSQSAVENGGYVDVLYNGTTYQYTYLGSFFAGGSTKVIINGTPGLPFNPPPGASIVIGNSGSLLPGADQLIGSGSSTPTTSATICCDGIGLNGDVVITGSLDVEGPVDVSGSVTVTGCIEVITSGSCDKYLFTGFQAGFRSSVFVADSGSWLTSLWVPNPPYGDISADLATAAANNNNVVSLFNPADDTVTYTELYQVYYNGLLNVIQLFTPAEVLPASYVIGIDGVAVLGGDTEVIITEDCFTTVVICDSGSFINSDVTISGSVGITGSLVVTETQSCTLYGFNGFAKSSQELTPGLYSVDFLFDPIYASNGNLSAVSSSIAATAAANNNEIRLVTTDGWNALYTVNSITIVGGSGGMSLTSFQSGTPILTPLTIMDVPFNGFTSSAANIEFPDPGCNPQNIAVFDGETGTVLSSGVTSQKSLVVGPNNTTADGYSSDDYKNLKFIGYGGRVGLDPAEKGYVLYLDEKYGDLSLYDESIFRASTLYLYNSSIKRYFTPDDLPGGFQISYDSTSRRVYIRDTTGDVINLSSNGQDMVAGIEGVKLTFADTPVLLNPTDMCLVVGSNNTADHASVLLGTSLQSGRANQTVVGQFNTPTSESLFVVGAGLNSGNTSNAFEVTTNGSIILPTTSSTAPSYSGSQGEMFFGDDGMGNYVIWAYLGGAWRSGSLH